MQIKVYTRSQNIELYTLSQRLITLPFPRVRLTHTTADGYLYQMLEDTTCDVAVNIDEDAFVVDNQAVLSLVDYVVENDIACCGMPDGGLLPIRMFNPAVVNPFFNVFNLSLIRSAFSREAVSTFDYDASKKQIISHYPAELLRFNNDGFSNIDYEPYYPFLQWLAYNFKILYLDAQEHADGITTILNNHKGMPMLYHTWYSREYEQDAYHKTRIDAVIDESYGCVRIHRPNETILRVKRNVEIIREYQDVANEDQWLRRASKVYRRALLLYKRIRRLVGQTAG